MDWTIKSQHHFHRQYDSFICSAWVNNFTFSFFLLDFGCGATYKVLSCSLFNNKKKVVFYKFGTEKEKTSKILILAKTSA